MRVILFQPRFHDAIRQGVKTSTIRVNARCKPGDVLSLRGWLDKPYRSKQFELTEPQYCREVTPIKIAYDRDDLGLIMGGGWSNWTTRTQTANQEGFQGWHDMKAWFKDNHKITRETPFTGELIVWQPQPLHVRPTPLPASPQTSVHAPEPFINLQKQPTGVTCVHTCLAMALDVPVQAVIDRYGPLPLGHKQLILALTECGFMWNQFCQGTLVATGWYFATVPSLNVRGANHQILFHYNVDYGCSGFHVLDPSTKETYAPDGSDLKSWANLILFHPGGRLPQPLTPSAP